MSLLTLARRNKCLIAHLRPWLPGSFWLRWDGEDGRRRAAAASSFISSNINWTRGGKVDSINYYRSGQPRSIFFSHSATDFRVERLTKLFGAPQEKVLCFVLRNAKFCDDDIKRLEALVDFFRSTGIDPQDALDYPKIIEYNSITLKRRYEVLSELGFQAINISSLTRYGEILQSSVSELCASKLLPDSVDVLGSLLAAIDRPPTVERAIGERYPLLARGPVHAMHQAVLLEYLAWRLQSGRKETIDLLEKYNGICHRSLRSVRDIIQLLVEEIGLEISKIRSNGFVLNLQADNVSSMLKTVPKLGGTTTAEVVRQLPRLLVYKTDNLRAVDEILQEHDITMEQISKCCNIYSLSPSTVRERMDVAATLKDFRNLKHHARYLNLIYYQAKVLKRLKVLKRNKAPITVDALITSESYFQNSIASEQYQHLKNECAVFLAGRLQTTKSRVLSRLKKHFIELKKTQMTNIYQAVNVLEEHSVSKETILDNLSLVFCDGSSLRKQLELLDKQRHGKNSTRQKIEVSMSEEDLQTLKFNLQIKLTKFGRRVDYQPMQNPFNLADVPSEQVKL